MAVSRPKPTKREKELEAKLEASRANEMAANRRALDAERALGARPQGDPPAWPSATERELALKKALDEANDKVAELERVAAQAQRASETNDLINFMKFAGTMDGCPDSFCLTGAIPHPEGGMLGITLGVNDLRRWSKLVQKRLIEERKADR